jgi:K+-sensing histidine kinase KdpD
MKPRHLKNKPALKILALGFGIAAITILHYADFGNNAAFHPIYRRLYYLPIILAAFHFRLKGGVAAATVISLAYLPHVFTYWKSSTSGRIENLLEILIFYTVGIVAGLLVSQEKNLWERTLRVERVAAFGQMAGMLTKDLRTSLAALRGLAQSFLGKMNGQAGWHFSRQLFLEHIDKIESRFGEIEQLAVDRQLRIKRGNLGEILDRCLAQYRNEFDTRKVYYSRTGLNDFPVMFMDMEKMERVIKFLLTAVLHRLSPGGTLTIHAEKEFGKMALHFVEAGDEEASRTNGKADAAPAFHLSNGAWYWLYVQRIVADHGGEIVWQQISRRSSILSLKLPLKQKLLIQSTGGSRLVAAEQAEKR